MPPNLPPDSSPRLADRPQILTSALYVICDVDVCAHGGWEPLNFARACMDGGARVLQIRAKTLKAGPLLELVERVVEAARSCSAAVIVNDRVDVAGLARAAGVHVGQDDLSVAHARGQLGAEAIVGLSTHTIAQSAGAAREPVSYVAVGPVFPTSTKDTGYTPVGVELISAARRVLPPAVPIVAIGGVTLDRARLAIEAGATSVAVISDLVTENPARRVAEYLRALSCAP